MRAHTVSIAFKIRGWEEHLVFICEHVQLPLWSFWTLFSWCRI